MRHVPVLISRGVLRAGTALVAAAVVIAGCGTAPAPAGNAGPPAGSRAAALALAGRMLSQVILPAGARAGQPRVLPQPLRGWPAGGAAGPDTADVHRFFSLRQQLPAAAAFLVTHPPRGMKIIGRGETGGPAWMAARTVDYSLRTLPRGIYQAGLTMAVASAADGGSWLRADAQVTWYPPSTAAERIDPAAFRQMTVSARLLSPRPRTVTRVFTSPAVVARLARILNSLPAAPQLRMSCPAAIVTYQVAFATAAGRPPAVVAAAAGCLTDTITSGGKPQPPLLDRGRLATAARGLLGLQAWPG